MDQMGGNEVKQIQQRGKCLLLALAMLLALTVPAFAAVTENDLEQAVRESAAYMREAVPNPQVGSIGGEWAVLGLARSGADVPQSYWDNYYKTVEEYVKACKGVLHEKKYTEYSRVIVALTAIGADPANVAGYNLLTPLGDFDKTIWQGINGPIWALIALDSGNYEMPVNAKAATQATRQMYIDEILSRQLNDGGWNLMDQGGDGSADPDITGMALQALAKYQDQSAVAAATERALTCLSGLQADNGGFASWGTSNSESCVQVIVALCELGIDLNDSRFVKNGTTLLDNLMTYRQADGSFLHTADGSGSNQMASEQGFYGLIAALRAVQGKQSLYRMGDENIQTEPSDTPQTAGLPGKHADVQKTAILTPGMTFDDISAHDNQPAIEAMAARGIITGKSAGVFDPEASMTRAEFAAIVVRALGLTPKANGQFDDVSASDWFAPYVGTANTYGIVNGTGERTFAPNGTITRQEAAVMVARAAGLCGMETKVDAGAVRNVLAQFIDYMTTAEWAREALAFCYQEDILDQADLDIRPQEAVRRCEVAQMLFNLLGSAKLL